MNKAGSSWENSIKLNELTSDEDTNNDSTSSDDEEESKGKPQAKSKGDKVNGVSTKQKQKVDNFFNRTDLNKTVVDYFNIPITVKTLKRLKSGKGNAKYKYLNDDVILFYLEILSKGAPHCFFHTPYFYEQMVDKNSKDDDANHNYRVTSSKQENQLKNLEKIFVPIHKPVHWCLACINLRDKCFEYYDSFRETDIGQKYAEQCLEKVKELLKIEAEKEHYNITPPIEEWSFKIRNDIPQQTNGFDCGVFLCKYAEFASRDRDFTFTQNDIVTFRYQIALDILHYQKAKTLEKLWVSNLRKHYKLLLQALPIKVSKKILNGNYAFTVDEQKTLIEYSENATQSVLSAMVQKTTGKFNEKIAHFVSVLVQHDIPFVGVSFDEAKAAVLQFQQTQYEITTEGNVKIVQKPVTTAVVNGPFFFELLSSFKSQLNGYGAELVERTRAPTLVDVLCGLETYSTNRTKWLEFVHTPLEPTVEGKQQLEKEVDLGDGTPPGVWVLLYLARLEYFEVPAHLESLPEGENNKVNVRIRNSVYSVQFETTKPNNVKITETLAPESEEDGFEFQKTALPALLHTLQPPRLLDLLRSILADDEEKQAVEEKVTSEVFELKHVWKIASELPLNNNDIRALIVLVNSEYFDGHLRWTTVGFTNDRVVFIDSKEQFKYNIKTGSQITDKEDIQLNDNALSVPALLQKLSTNRKDDFKNMTSRYLATPLWVSRTFSQYSNRYLLQFARDEFPVLEGLTNAGNTCFANSVLQCLFATASFTGYLQTTHSKYEHSSPQEKCFLCSLSTLWDQRSDKTPNNTEDFATKILWNKMKFTEKGMDSSVKFFEKVLEELDHFPAVRDLFRNPGLKLKTCPDTTCAHKTRTDIPYNQLNLALYADAQEGSSTALYEVLLNSTRSTASDFRCESCKETVNVDIQDTFPNFAPIITLSLERKTTNQNDAEFDTRKIEIPEVFDFGDFGGSGPQWYSLVGVVVYRTLHYVAYVKYRESWYLANDSKFTKITETAFKDIDEISTHSVFLVYERRAPVGYPSEQQVPLTGWLAPQSRASEVLQWLPSSNTHFRKVLEDVVAGTNIPHTRVQLKEWIDRLTLKYNEYDEKDMSGIFQVHQFITQLNNEYFQKRKCNARTDRIVLMPSNRDLLQHAESSTQNHKTTSLTKKKNPLHQQKKPPPTKKKPQLKK